MMAQSARPSLPMGDPWFLQCVAVASSNSEFVDQWLRLRGINLPRSTIERLVSESTGEGDAVAELFLKDVYDLIYSRMERPQKLGG